MSEWLSLLGAAAPFLVILLCSIGSITGNRLWSISLVTHLISWLCFLTLSASYYSSMPSGNSVESSLLVGVWGHTSLWKWDYLGSVLALTACTITIASHFLSKNLFEHSRSTIAAVAGFQLCLLGALGSASLFLFSVFLAGILVPQLILVGLDKSNNNNGLVREYSLLNIISFILLMVCVLVFVNPFQNIPSEWFQIDLGSYAIKSGALGFSILFLVIIISSGFFPFHGRVRRAYQMDFLERAILLSLQPVLGVLPLFRFLVVMFPDELKEFGPLLAQFFSLILLISAISFAGSKNNRERIFWLQQIILGFVFVGFFSLSLKGWHGSFALLLFQCLAVPFFIMIYICHLRVGGVNSFIKIFSNRALAFSTAVSVLAILGAPVSVGFYGLLLISWSAVSAGTLSMICILLALPLVIYSGVRILFFELMTDTEVQVSSQIGGLSKFDMMAILPITGILLFLGLVPKLLMGPMGEAVTGFLASIGIN